MIALSQGQIADLSDCVLRPNYDRGALRAGIVHNGLGNFHRAHQAWYFHRLLQMGEAQDWAIIGDGMRPYDAKMRSQLSLQDFLLLGIETVPQAMSHETIGAFFRCVAPNEIAPLVKSVGDMTPQAYVGFIQERFANQAILDTIRGVAFDGSSRYSGFILPTMRDALSIGTALNGLAIAEAAWAHMCLGQREDGSHIPPNDPDRGRLSERAKAAHNAPLRWIELRENYRDLAQAPRFVTAFDTAYRNIRDKGIVKALQFYQEGS